MTNQPAQQSEFGLVAWLENTRVALPLKGVECRIEVTGAIACVELDQIYHQNTARPLDCTYTFPLPAGAAVYRCELHVNGRVIRAKVEEKETARRIFREQKAAGRRAALVETERENVFTLALGNVQPGDVIVVRFAWFQVLDRAGDGLRLLVPTCPGVRYIPGKPLLRALSGRGTADDTDQVPDASRITPPRIDALHPDAAYFSIEGRLSSADVATGTASSPSHPIYVRESDGAVTVELSGRDAVPDRDFVLAWREPKARQLAPQAWHWTEAGETYALVQLRAPEGVQVAAGFPQDFYFLVDRSSSMAGAKWQRTCEALHAFVGLLGAQDRVWITLFESNFRDFAEAPLPAPTVLADRGFQRMAALGVTGGTDLLPAADHVLQQIATHSADRRPNVVLITDGQVGNDHAIIHAFQQAPNVRVHTFGIDTAVNDAFLQALARQQRGGCWLQTPDDDIAGTIAALGDRLRRPVITALAFGGSWETGRTTWPDLHAHEVVAVTLRGHAATPLEITGRLPDGREHRFAVDLGTAGSEAIKLLWAKERIAALLEADHQPEAIALAKQHNVLCQGAAFIAWDEAEQVPVAEDEIVQPALQPLMREAHSMEVIRDRISSAPGSGIRCDNLVDGFFNPGNSVKERPYHREKSDILNARIVRSLDRGTREAFQKAGFPEPAVGRLLVWAHSPDGDSAKRLHELFQTAQLIAQMRTLLNTAASRDLLESGIRRVMDGPPEALIDWAKDSQPASEQIGILQRQLKLTKAPEPLIEHLIAWVLASGIVNRDRLEQLMAFVNSLDDLPFSAGALARRWQNFLESTVGTGAEAYTLAMRWLEKQAGAPSVPAARYWPWR